MKHLIKTTLLLLALLLPTLTHALDFEVNGIYYITNGTNATVTSGNNEYSGSVTIPATVTYGGTTYSVTSIGNSAFEGCSGLTAINIPNSVTSIGDKAFWNCTGLTAINIPNSVTTIGYGAFYGTAWYNNQPDGVIYAGLVAYQYKGTMPVGTSITLRNGTKGIANRAFYGCTGLTTINIPNSVTTIGERAFYNCTSLTTINIPNSVTTIGTYAFYNCTSLTTANIGNSVTSIGDKAFNACPSLTNITVASDNPKYDSRNNCNAIIETETNTLIFGCKNTTIPNSVTTIGNYAFYECSSLTSINIPNSVTYTGSYTFQNCTSLTIVNIPNSVTTIGYGTFWGCTSLTTINIPNSVTRIGQYTFSGCSSLTTINIPNSVTYIDVYAFSDCTSLTTINIPNSVTSIGNYAFSGCTSLTTINIPNSVTRIFDFTFFKCSSLTTAYIGNSVTFIRATAFYGCTSLNDIYCYATTPPQCYDTSFSNYSATLHVPAASLADYSTATVWSNFETIVGDAVAPTGITISKDRVVIPLNIQFELTATVSPDNASYKEVTWYSTDAGVATVDNGTVTAVSIGECDIIASCMGISATCHIYVEATPGDVNGDGVITINDATMMIDYLLGGEIDNFMAENADVNKDGQFSVSDITDFIDILLNSGN